MVHEDGGFCCYVRCEIFCGVYSALESGNSLDAGVALSPVLITYRMVFIEYSNY